VESCNAGDIYDLGDTDKKYFEATLYNELSYSATPTWRSCDYGYVPTACDLAVLSLEAVMFPEKLRFESILGPRLEAPLCDPENATNIEQCSAQCMQFIDEVVESCDMPGEAMFAPSESDPFSPGPALNQPTLWEFPKSSSQFGWNPATAFVSSFALSGACYDYCAASVMALAPFEEPSTATPSLIPGGEPTVAITTSGSTIMMVSQKFLAVFVFLLFCFSP